MTKILIIGAGHNGLVCAAYLAKAGLDVLIVERSPYVGGGCVTQELLPGYRFSTFAYGAHGPGPKICSDLEIPADAFAIAAPNPTSVQLFPDGDRVILWREQERTEAELARFGKSEVEGYRAYQDFCRRAVRICESCFLAKAPTADELRAKWRDPKDAAVLDVLLTGCLWDVLCQCFQSEQVRTTFARADDCGPPNNPGSALAEFMESASTGLGVKNEAGILEHGMGRITQVLAARVSACGGTIRTSAAVRRIVVKNGRATGVELESGEIIEADAVISNADPKRTFLRLVDAAELSGSFRESVTEIKTRASYMKFFATLNDVPHFRALNGAEMENPKMAANVRIVPSLAYMEQCWAESQRGELPTAPILSMQLPTAYWPSQAPAGKHIFGAWVRWGPAKFRDGLTWDAHRERMAERILDIVESYAPGFRRSVEWTRLLTPLDIERETGMTDACIRHVDMTLDQMLDRRPIPSWAQYRTPIDGLWLCGSGTHPCGVVTGGPGHNCAETLLKTLAR